MTTAPGDKSAPKRPDVFISYSRKDREFVKRLDAALQARGREAWVDWEGIRPAEEFMQAIFPAIEGTDTFVFVISPDSVTSDVCGKELAHAATHNKRMVPIIAREVDAKTVPEPLAKLNWVFFCRENDDFNVGVESLISALDTDLDWVHAHTRLLTRAIEWEAKGKSNSFVLRGEDLRAAEQWLAQAGIDKERQPTSLQTEYIIASRKASSKRQRIALGAVTFGALVAVVLAILAWKERGTAVQQTARAIMEKEHSLQIASRGDFVAATRLIAQADTTRALAYLARALELWPANHAAADRLFTLLTQRRFLLPLTDSLPVNGRVTCLRFGPDGRCLVVSVKDQSASVWEVGGKVANLTTVSCPYPVQDAQLSPDLKLLATACGLVPTEDIYPTGNQSRKAAGSAQLWNVSSGQPLQGPLEHSAEVESVRFHPNGHQLITSSADQTAQIWNVDSGVKIGEALPLSAPGIYAVFSPSGSQVITLAAEARLWNLETNTHLPLTIHAENPAPLRAEFSPDGKFVAVMFAASNDGDSYRAITVFDCGTGKPVANDSGGLAPDVPSIAFSASGATIVLSVAGLYRNKDSIGGVEIITAATGERNSFLECARPVNDARFSADNTNVYYGGDDGELHIRGVSDFNKDAAEFAEPVRFGSPLMRCEPQTGGQQLAVVFGDPSRKQDYVQLFDTRTFTQHNEVVPAADLGGRTASLGVSDGAVLDKQGSGKLFILGFEDGTACVAHNQTDRTVGVRHGTGPGTAILTAKFGPDGSFFATGGGGDFRIGIGYARIWKTADNVPLTELLPHDRAVIDLDFTGDGKRLLTLASSYPKETGFATRVWDVETGQLLCDAKKDDIDLGVNIGARLVDDGRRVVTVASDEGSEPMAQAWDSGFGRSASVPSWLPRLAKLIGGYELPEQGEVLQPIVGRASELRALTLKLSGDASIDAYTRFAKWFLDRSGERKLSPYATLSVAARIDQCLKEGTDSVLKEAESLADGDSKILERISVLRKAK